MAKSKACDVCSLRKIRCTGTNPCDPCTKSGFDCSFAKKPLKPGPKGPRLATSSRIRKQLDNIRAHGVASPASSSKRSASAQSASRPQLSNPLNDNDASEQAFTLEYVRFYLQKYREKMYPVWPVIDLPYLVDHFEGDQEQAALAFALCAATGALLRLDEDMDSVAAASGVDIFDQFAKEAERRRSQYDHWDRATMAGVLIPFFLHAYYTKKQKRRSSSLYIREAVTLAQLLGIDKELTFDGLATEEAHFRRKVFWLLFVTERGHSMQFGLSTILRPAIAMPKAEDDKDPGLLTEFLTLVRLFVNVDGMLAGTDLDDPGRAFSADTLEALQRRLQRKPDFTPFSNEVQRTDIFVTQQWMRTLLWQLSMKKVSLIASGADHPLSLTYPTDVARDTLSFLSQASLDSLVAHGVGMELKIFEIASTLLDVINVVPTVSTRTTVSQQAPRDVFHALSCLLSEISSGKSSTIGLLQSKLAENNAILNSVPRLLELDDPASSLGSSTSPPEVISPELRDSPSAGSHIFPEESPVDQADSRGLTTPPFQALSSIPGLERQDSNTSDALAMEYVSDTVDSPYEDPTLFNLPSPSYAATWVQLR